MPSVRPTDPNQERILSRQVRADVALPLTSILATDQDVNEALDAAPIQAESTCDHHDRVFFSGSTSINDDVGYRSKSIYIALGRRCANLIIVGDFFNLSFTLLVTDP